MEDRSNDKSSCVTAPIPSPKVRESSVGSTGTDALLTGAASVPSLFAGEVDGSTTLPRKTTSELV